MKNISVYLGIVIFAFSPIIVALLAMFVGTCLGCEINAAASDPCIRLGIPFGQTLSGLAMMHLLAMATIPSGIMAAIAWTIYILVGNFTKKR